VPGLTFENIRRISKMSAIYNGVEGKSCLQLCVVGVQLLILYIHFMYLLIRFQTILYIGNKHYAITGFLYAGGNNICW
jgi:hypothetical protein